MRSFFERARELVSWFSARKHRHLSALQRATIGLTLLYGVAMIIGWLIVSRVGERHWLTSLVLFAPVALCWMPLLVVYPLGLLFCRSACVLQIGFVAVVHLWFTPFHWSRSTEAEGDSLTVISNNAGQRRIATLFPLVDSAKPDLVALQEVAPAAGLALAMRDERLHRAQQGEFALLSRFPIVDSGLVEDLTFEERTVAAWFTVEIGGQQVVVYNIRLPSPRRDFHRLRGRGFLAELPRLGGIYSASVWSAYRASLAERVELAEQLALRLAAESRPFIAVGDLNAPSQGYVRRLFCLQAVDAFAATGRGFGLTFPGRTRNPLAFFGPWQRLDYIFTGTGFRPLECRVEPRQRAQHRAVVARLEFTP
jgi:endonuclease/exonuclease/phosphatase (EEP) superfamily protein YafD